MYNDIIAQLSVTMLSIFIEGLPELKIDPIPDFSDFEEFIRLSGSSNNSKLADDWLLNTFVKSADKTFNPATLTFTKRMELLKFLKNADSLFTVVNLSSDTIKVNSDEITFNDPIGDYMYSLQEFSQRNNYQLAALKGVRDCYSLNGTKFKDSTDINFYHGMVAFKHFLDRF